jgi:hypothetical protein
MIKLFWISILTFLFWSSLYINNLPSVIVVLVIYFYMKRLMEGYYD